MDGPQDAGGDGGGPGEGPGEAPELEEMKTSFLRLFRYLKPYRWLFAGSLLCMVGAALFDAFSLTLLIPFLRSLFGETQLLTGGSRVEEIIRWAVGDWIQTGSSLASLRNICLVVFGAVVLKNVFLYGARFLGVVVQERIERDMRDEVYGHLQFLPLSFFNETKAGQLITRVLTDTRETKRIVSFALANVLRQAVVSVAYLAVMIDLSWQLTLLAGVLAPVLVGVLRPILRRLRKGFRAVYDEQGDLLSLLQETVSGIRLVKAYGAEEYEQGRFQESSDRFARGMIRTEAVRELASPLSEVLSAAVAVALLWIGAQLVHGAGTLGPEAFMTFITVALRLISPVKALAAFPARAQSALAAADRFFEIVDEPPEPRDDPAAVAVDDFREEIAFEDVTFAYEEGRPVLREVSFSAAKGDVTALVGRSGAGKSTLVDLLPRFIEPDGGRITLDGRDLREVSLDSLRSLMGVVSQQTVIFNDSVRANIAYGDDRWSDEEVWRAAEAARAADFVRGMPRELDTRLGDRGVRLSGGQRQRIGIARAILRDPPILILDEATSNLDTEVERLIQQALDRLLEGRTVFVIAHRLSTVQGADRILVLDDGRLVERGTHDELYERGGLYRRLYELQFETEAEGFGAAAAEPVAAEAGAGDAGVGHPGGGAGAGEAGSGRGSASGGASGSGDTAGGEDGP